MILFTRAIFLLTLSLSITACGSGNNQPKKLGIDRSAALKRAKKSIISMQEILKMEGVTKPTDMHLQELADLMTTEMNEEPRIHHRHIGIQLLKNFAFEGYEDRNQNDTKEKREKRLFKIEVDFENNRLLASGSSESTGYTGRNINSGFLSGMLMQRFSNRQQQAGVSPGFFNNRSVQSHASYSENRSSLVAAAEQRNTRSRTRSSGIRTASRSRTSSARSRARSGSRFSGK